MPGKAQRRRTIVVNGPDPTGSANWDALAAQTAAELSSDGAPLSRRVGMKGDPGKTAYGDLGALQQFPAAYGNPFPPPLESAQSQGLPAPSSASSGSTSLRDYVAQFQAG